MGALAELRYLAGGAADRLRDFLHAGDSFPGQAVAFAGLGYSSLGTRGGTVDDRARFLHVAVGLLDERGYLREGGNLDRGFFGDDRDGARNALCGLC